MCYGTLLVWKCVIAQPPACDLSFHSSWHLRSSRGEHPLLLYLFCVKEAKWCTSIIQMPPTNLFPSHTRNDGMSLSRVRKKPIQQITYRPWHLVRWESQHSGQWKTKRERVVQERMSGIKKGSSVKPKGGGGGLTRVEWIPHASRYEDSSPPLVPIHTPHALTPLSLSLARVLSLSLPPSPWRYPSQPYYSLSLSDKSPRSYTTPRRCFHSARELGFRPPSRPSFLSRPPLLSSCNWITGWVED